MPDTVRSSEETLGSLLNSHFFNVPVYQRRYAWKEENVQKLFTDLIDHFENFENDEFSESYLLGNIILSQGHDDRFDVVDGQQRLTTLIILLCSIRDYLENLGSEREEIIQQILLPKVFRNGVKTSKIRLQVSYMDGTEFIDSLINSRSISTIIARSDQETLPNLIAAYEFFTKSKKASRRKEAVSCALEEVFGIDQIRINQFINHMLNNIFFIVVKKNRSLSAFKVFETLNARGVGLTDCDLMKNMIFTRADESTHEIIDSRWSYLLERFLQKDLTEFLMDYALARFPRLDIREGKLYEFFSERDVLAKYDNNMIYMLDDILVCAEVYTRMTKRSLSPEGFLDEGLLKNITLLGNKRKIKSHFSLMLATYLYHPTAWHKVLKAVETVILVDRIVQSRNHEGLRVFPRWRKEIIDATPNDAPEDGKKTIDDVLGDIYLYIKDSLKDVNIALQAISLESMNRTLRKYILAKIYSHVEKMAYELPTSSFSALMSREMEEEHCLPQNPDDSVIREFGIEREDLGNYVWRLGNLLLLEKSNNRTCSNRGFSEKAKHYRNSSFLLNRVLVEQLFDGSSNRIARTIQAIQPYKSWNAVNVEDRGALYRKLFIDSIC